jgi:hypothetical protein
MTAAIALAAIPTSGAPTPSSSPRTACSTNAGSIDSMQAGLASPRGHCASQSGVDHQQPAHGVAAMLRWLG